MTSFPDPRSPTSGLSATYDAWNRLVEVKNSSNTVITANEYDGLNRRIVRDETGAGGDKRHFYYNERWQVLEERVEVSGTINPNPLAQYVWHPYYVDALAVRYYDENTDGAGIVRHWYTQDANFNVTAVVNDSGTPLERYSYSPYGEVTFLNPDFSKKLVQESAIGNNYLYTGRERDPETGLQLNRHRYYHPGLGRWISQDPIGYDGSEWNLYEYVNGMPIVNVDPQGLAFGCKRTPILPCTGEDTLYVQAEKRRGGGHKGDDSTHHCWAICMLGSMFGPFAAQTGAHVGNYLEIDDPDGRLDEIAHKRGVECSWSASLASLNPFGECPEVVCDRCCGSRKVRF